MTVIDAPQHLRDRSGAHYPVLTPQLQELDREVVLAGTAVRFSGIPA